MEPKEEYFELFDEDDRPLGRQALRSECHGNPSLIHRTAHVVIFDSIGRLLLQKRTMTKDIQPGKWDTAVGGHLDPGEDYEDGARREMNEELGIPADLPLKFLFKTKIRNDIESENIGVFCLVYDGPFSVDPVEIQEVRYWDKTEVEAAMGTDVFTFNLEYEIGLLKEENLF